MLLSIKTSIETPQLKSNVFTTTYNQNQWENSCLNIVKKEFPKTGKSKYLNSSKCSVSYQPVNSQKEISKDKNRWRALSKTSSGFNESCANQKSSSQSKKRNSSKELPQNSLNFYDKICHSGQSKG